MRAVLEQQHTKINPVICTPSDNLKTLQLFYMGFRDIAHTHEKNLKSANGSDKRFRGWGECRRE